MFVSDCIPEGHALVIAVDGALLQSYLVHAVSGGGGLCLMRVFVREHLLQYKNTSRRARGDDATSVICTETHQDAARTHSQAYVVETARVGPRAAILRAITFLGRAHVLGVEEVKKRGCPSPPEVRS